MSSLVQAREDSGQLAIPKITYQAALHWTLRIGLAMCYIGHGAFGIITKAAWLPYFGFVGIPESVAWKLMPIVGTMDVLMGIAILLYPVRPLLFWASFWTVWTALLRPFTGEGWWEFLERGGNYGLPIAMLYLSGFTGPDGTLRSYLTGKARSVLTPRSALVTSWILRITTAILLIGHGGFGLFMHKKAWFSYFGVLGIGKDTAQSLSLLSVVGAFEILLGIAVLIKPARPFVLAIFVYKVGFELLRPLSGEPFWEVVERGGSYAAPLGLFIALSYLHRQQTAPEPAGELPALSQQAARAVGD
jgi:hypothetical protein